MVILQLLIARISRLNFLVKPSIRALLSNCDNHFQTVFWYPNDASIKLGIEEIRIMRTVYFKKTKFYWLPNKFLDRLLHLFNFYLAFGYPSFVAGKQRII